MKYKKVGYRKMIPGHCYMDVPEVGEATIFEFVRTDHKNNLLKQSESYLKIVDGDETGYLPEEDGTIKFNGFFEMFEFEKGYDIWWNIKHLVQDQDDVEDAKNYVYKLEKGVWYPHHRHSV